MDCKCKDEIEDYLLVFGVKHGLLFFLQFHSNCIVLPACLIHCIGIVKGSQALILVSKWGASSIYIT